MLLENHDLNGVTRNSLERRRVQAKLQLRKTFDRSNSLQVLRMTDQDNLPKLHGPELSLSVELQDAIAIEETREELKVLAEAYPQLSAIREKIMSRGTASMLYKDVTDEGRLYAISFLTDPAIREARVNAVIEETMRHPDVYLIPPTDAVPLS